MSITIKPGTNRVIKLHLKNNGVPFDLTDKMVKISMDNGRIIKELYLHDFPKDGLTHFLLTSDETEQMGGAIKVNIEICKI